MTEASALVWLLIGTTLLCNIIQVHIPVKFENNIQIVVDLLLGTSIICTDFP